MSYETTYRLMLLAVIMLLFPVALYHRLRSFTGERLARRDEGLLVLVGLRLTGLAVWLELLFYLINPSWMSWFALPLPGWLRSAGFAMGIAAVIWLAWMLRALGQNLTDTVNVRAGAWLVTTGPYRFVRHPMYVGLVALLPSIALITANMLIALSGILVVSLLIKRTSTEEAKLVARFGEDYRRYASRTGRFVPRLP
jgi:protein-S-isoprenylcysteine O-methyltransferase Ste14